MGASGELIRFFGGGCYREALKRFQWKGNVAIHFTFPLVTVLHLINFRGISKLTVQSHSGHIEAVYILVLKDNKSTL